METGDKRALGKRLMALRGRMAQSDFARLLGVHKNTLARYESGERLPDTGFLAAVAQRGVNLHWFVTGEGSRHAAAANIESNVGEDLANVDLGGAVNAVSYVRISELKSALGGIDNTTASAALAFGRDWLASELTASADDLVIAQIKGDSMEPTVCNGDWVLADCRPPQTALRDGLFLMRISDSLVLRRVQVLPGRNYRILCANTVYPELKLSAEMLGDDPKIIGRAVWVGQRLT